MNEVSKVCSWDDHHPEWNLKGHTLNVFLTSHWNDNKVSVMDYKLAAAMNEQFNETGPLAGYHPNDKTYAVEIGVGIAFLIALYFARGYTNNVNTMTNYKYTAAPDESLAKPEKKIIRDLSDK